MTDPPQDLQRRLEAGDAEVAERIFASYSARLAGVASQHLSRKLAGRIDPEDVVQSVFRTFFRRGAEGKFRFDESGQLWKLLVRITVLKARAKAREHVAGIRDVRRETDPDESAWLTEAAAREPGPLEAAILVDQIEAALHSLPAMYCQILDLRLQDFGPGEIAAKLGVSRQTVHRCLNLLQRRLESEGDL